MSASIAPPITVLVLGGGPDAEREVSLNSSRCVAEAIKRAGRHAVNYQIIDRPGAPELRRLDGDVIFPVLHGGWGEGGPLQDLLEIDGRSYVGSGPRASRLAMDKIATKVAAITAGIPTAESAIFDPRDSVCPLGLPVVIKPVHEGSSVGVHLCRDQIAWDKARAKAAGDMRQTPGRVSMLERLIAGAELTVGVLDPASDNPRALPIIRIEPAVEFYDYEAKYTRNDTRYTVAPALAAGITETVRDRALTLAKAMGIRHLCRVDFLLDEKNRAWLLEVNTMPGFTDHSLMPMAAAHEGMGMPTLCVALVEMALRDQRSPAKPSPTKKPVLASH